METQPTFKVRFWGVRGSYPTPGPETARYGGNTPCVELEVNGQTIILDSGTGIIPLGRSLARRARERGLPLEATLLLSHLHHDHTQGFPFFVPVHFPTANLHVFGPNLLGADPRMTLESVMQPPYFPLRLADLNARISFDALRETDLLLIGEAVGGVAIRPTSEASQYEGSDVVQVRSLRSYAHPNGVMHYKVSWNGLSVVYATDTEGYVNGDQRLAAFARGAALLIHDAQYTDEHYLGLLPGISITQGYGHSTVSMACQAATAAGAQCLALFHHAPEYDDARLDQVSAQARELFPNVLVAAEGLEMDLTGGLALNTPQINLPLAVN
ncbi:MAG TPA: MBL fold metallo-hydrolase [Anaerolineaceae bacterium]|jgi:phosphoribosyl 1,2-cyclic phosphodiesterase|nr:MBL fold metallo-hydrolase [Anaerolineaceae bacterium]